MPSLTIVGSHENQGEWHYTIQATDAGRTWTVQKRFHDFEVLDQQSAMQGGCTRLPLPEKGLFGFRQALNIGGFREKRQEGLQLYLQHMAGQMQSFAQHPPLTRFLDPTVQPPPPVQQYQPPAPQFVAPSGMQPGAPSVQHLGGVSLADFAAVQQQRNTALMAAFIRRLLELSGGRAADGDISGLAHYYSGEQAAQPWERLLQECAEKGWLPGGASAFLSEQGYQAVAARRNNGEMEAFARRVLAAEGGRVLNEGSFSGFIPYYSGVEATQSLAALQGELRGKAVGEGWVRFDQAPMVPQMPVAPHMPGFPAQHQRCFKCEGHGFAHESSMPHDKPHGEKCFFCTPCSGCGGSGAIAGGGPMAPFFGGVAGPQRCFKCEGHGFCHESTMPHDKPHGEKCFFCKPCSGCGGSGAIAGGGIPGVSSGSQRCYKCEGHGFAHQSSMPHDKPHGEKCFFCETCSGCGGRGHL